MNSKVLKSGVAKKPPAAGIGRKKGTPNKNTALIRDMIAQALDQVGGVAYLADVAITHPGPFLALIGKVMPVQIEGAGGGPVDMSFTLNFK